MTRKVQKKFHIPEGVARDSAILAKAAGISESALVEHALTSEFLDDAARRLGWRRGRRR